MKKTEKEYIQQIKQKQRDYLYEQANIDFFSDLVWRKIPGCMLASIIIAVIWITIFVILVSKFNLSEEFKMIGVIIFIFFLCILPMALCLANLLISLYMTLRIKFVRKKLLKEFPYYAVILRKTVK